jgi:hypothetical protein
MTEHDGMSRRATRAVGLAMAATLLAGCASYTDRMHLVRADYAAGNYPAAAGAIDPDDCESGRDQLVFLLERGTVRQAQGDFVGSNEDFEHAYRVITDFEERAKISLRDGLSETQALLVNDTALPYKGEGFEKMLLHAMKAINYLMLSDLEGARVEIKRLDERRKIEQEAHEREIAQSQEQAQENNLSAEQVSGVEQNLYNSYGPALQIAKRIQSLYLSPFGSLVSSLVYDLEGEYDEALVDMRRVMAEAPQFAAAALDAYSLGADDLPPPPVSLDLRKTGDLVVFFHCGLAPEKREVSLAIPVGDAWIAIAFPFYAEIPTAVDHADVFIDGALAGSTRLVGDVEAQAVKSLVEQAPALVIRQMVRAVVKGVAAHAAEKENGWAGFLVNMYNILSEQADLRSWLTLPKSLQAFRYYPPVGKHTVRIAVADAGGRILGEVSLEKDFANDRTVLANVRGIGFTPVFPNGLNITAQWQTLPRAPLSGRPRFVMHP